MKIERHRIPAGADQSRHQIMPQLTPQSLTSSTAALGQQDASPSGSQVLLTVSGVIDSELEEQIAQGLRPQADYVAMAEGFGADLLDYAEARRTIGWFGRFLESCGGPNLLLAWTCYQRRHRTKCCSQTAIKWAFLTHSWPDCWAASCPST
ncbi:MAG: hypothetical protein ACI9EF_000304 [Pseudohongiellaceae bacterium]|jgi:hypothetical protein